MMMLMMDSVSLGSGINNGLLSDSFHEGNAAVMLILRSTAPSAQGIYRPRRKDGQECPPHVHDQQSRVNIRLRRNATE